MGDGLTAPTVSSLLKEMIVAASRASTSRTGFALIAVVACLAVVGIVVALVLAFGSPTP